MEYLEENLEDWLHEQLGGYGDDDYLFFDCPGQIELYSHLSVFQSLVQYLKGEGWNVGCIYCVDAQFTEDSSKYISGCLSALSAMIQLELPHLNVMTKIDLVQDPSALEHGFIFPDRASLLQTLDQHTSDKYRSLNAAIVGLLDNYSMVAFVPLDVTDEESIESCMLQADMAIQYGEDQDVRIPNEGGEEDNGDDD